MGRYGAELNKSPSDLTDAVGSVAADATTPRRIKLYDLIVGSEATPADNEFKWTVQRATTAPTGSAVTAEPLDPADAAALSDVVEGITANGSLTAGAIPLSFALNQRATFRWVAAPGGEIVVPATANNGLHILTPVAGNLPAVTATINFEEQ